MKEFYVLDLDRTLVNTDKLYTILEEVLVRLGGIEIKHLRTERARVEATGGTFSVIDYLHKLLVGSQTTYSWIDIQEAFIQEAQGRQDVLEPYAADFLKILDERHLPYGIITFGKEAWQLAKLEATNLMSVPHLVTAIKEKGILMSGWKQVDGTLLIPPAMTRDFKPMAVDSIVFVDDKAVSFENLPQGVRGVFVKSPSGVLLPSQQGSLPDTVTTVIGLDGAINLLFEQ